MDDNSRHRPVYYSDFRGLETRVRHLEHQVARLIAWVVAGAAGGSAGANFLLDYLGKP